MLGRPVLNIFRQTFHMILVSIYTSIHALKGSSRFKRFEKPLSWKLWHRLMSRLDF